ncbi:HEAT repeat domain-containing protein [Pedosphaera parvula]|uniref:HEAT domain containing protein n=1 Tax=Pedosphaera parvula (strain Ellin514) TaxID=320771 RepID=B9XS72_PEDPL|nr:hypothetical protein [Pedosphaera parvula]EEF57327.1 hypothetical protein Cflav_PD0336 [Pedosphaera parvula Ellin514]
MKITPPTNNPTSRRRTKVIVVALILISIAGLAWLLTRTREPSYNGKPFTLWLEEYSQKNRSGTLTEENRQSMKVLGQMGPKAVPIIVRAVEKNDSPMINKYRETWPKLPGLLKKVLPEPKPEAFFVSDAHTTFLHFVTPDFAANAVPQLIQLPRSHNPAVREVALQCLLSFKSMYPHSFPDKDLLSISISGLKDSSALARAISASLISAIGPAASNAVPALITTLQGSEAYRKGGTVDCRSVAACALGRIGPAAASSLPALTNLLTSTNVYLRIEVASAVWRITSDEHQALPILISDIPTLDSTNFKMLDKYKKYNAIICLAEMGPRATNALPMLLNELTNSKNDAFILAPITNALKAIDPAAAAKAGVK